MGSFAGTEFNERQRSMINRLLNGFEGKLTSSKWAKLEKCSQDTALRDIEDLIRTGVLMKDSAGGGVRPIRSQEVVRDAMHSQHRTSAKVVSGDRTTQEFRPIWQPTIRL